MIVNDGHVHRVWKVVLVARPVVIQLLGAFVRTPTLARVEPLATFTALAEEVMLLERRVSHPRWVVASVAAVVNAKVREEVVVH